MRNTLQSPAGAPAEPPTPGAPSTLLGPRDLSCTSRHRQDGVPVAAAGVWGRPRWPWSLRAGASADSRTATPQGRGEHVRPGRLRGLGHLPALPVAE